MSDADEAARPPAPLAPPPQQPQPRQPKLNVGRNKKGRFVKGNIGGPGNPYAKYQHEWQRRFYQALTPEDFTDVVEELIRIAKGGEGPQHQRWAIPELLNRALGKPKETVEQTVVKQVSVEQRIANVMAILGVSPPPPAAPPPPQQQPQSSVHVQPDLDSLPPEDRRAEADEPPAALPAPVAQAEALQGLGEVEARGGDVDRCPVVRGEEADQED